MAAMVFVSILAVFLTYPLRFEIVSAPNPRLFVRYFGFEMDQTQWLKQLRFKRAPSKAQVRALKLLLRRAKVSKFAFKLQFSTGDAAQTALLHGALCMCLSAVYPHLQGCKPNIALLPQYQDSIHFDFDIDIQMQVPPWAIGLFFIRIYALKQQTAKEQKLCTIKTN